MSPTSRRRIPIGTRAPSLHGRLVNSIGRRILSGALRPGDTVSTPPGEPASRTAIREAMKVLSAKGLIELRPKIGTRVRPRDAWNLLDRDVLGWQREGSPPAEFLRRLTEVRAIIEPAAAALAASRASAADIAAIAAAYDDMAQAVAPARPDIARFVEADARFHAGILHAAGNEILFQMSTVVFSALVVLFQTTSQLPGSAKASLPRHRAILKAIARAEPDRARAAMAKVVRASSTELEHIDRPPAPSRIRRT